MKAIPLLKICICSALLHYHLSYAQSVMEPQAPAGGGDISQAALPLVSEALRITIDQQYATTEIAQAFLNRADVQLEGRYRLRTSGNAQVRKFAYWNGETKIVGEVFEKQTAERIYSETTGLRRDPGILEQTGEGAFSFRVFPILPAERKRVEVVFGQNLVRTHQTVAYRIPLNLSDAQILVQLADTRRLKGLRSATHSLQVQKQQSGQLRIRALPKGAPSEFWLSYEIDQRPWKLSVALHQDRGQDAFMVLRMAMPEGISQATSPKDVTLVLDHSGSMGGQPLAQAKLAAQRVIQRLRPGDRMNLLIFDDGVDRLYAKPRSVSPATKQAASSFIQNIREAGGTNLALALREALGGQHADPRRPRIILFLTDGESEAKAVFEAANRDTSTTRIFTIGVGPGVNKPLLSRLASQKRGRFTYIESAPAILSQVEKLFQQLEDPVLINLSLEAQQGALYRMYPKTLADLSRTDELVVTGRLRGTGPVKLRLQGTLGGKTVAYQTTVSLPVAAARPWVGRLWAQQRTEDLLEEIALNGESEELKNEALEMALAYDLVTPYTSFLAIPETELQGESKALADSARQRKRAILAANPDAAALSRSRMPPGDPILSVKAPRDARQVTATFPFGLIKDLEFEQASGSWRTRFLVPKAVADGVYVAQVLVVYANGQSVLLDAPYTIDSSEPDFVVTTTPTANGVQLRVETREPAREVTVVWLGRSQIRLGLAASAEGIYQGLLALPAGEHTLRVTVADQARNEATQLIKCVVGGPHAGRTPQALEH